MAEGKVSISLSEDDVPPEGLSLEGAITKTATGISIDDTKVAAEAKAAQEKKADAEAKRPEWLPEKFKTPEDLLKAYQEAEKKISEKPAKEDPTPKEGAEETPAEPVADAQALREITAKLTEQAGSAANLKATLEWAKESASPSAVEDYNAALKSGRQSLISAAFDALKAERADALGEDPSLVEGEEVPGIGGAKGFASEGEMLRFMDDPRYKEGDPAYHEEFKKRMARTKFFDKA